VVGAHAGVKILYRRARAPCQLLPPAQAARSAGHAGRGLPHRGAALDVADCRAWIARDAWRGDFCQSFGRDRAGARARRGDFQRCCRAPRRAIGAPRPRTHRARLPAVVAESATLQDWRAPPFDCCKREPRTMDSLKKDRDAPPVDAWRRMVRETHLTPDAFIYPLFVCRARRAPRVGACPDLSAVGGRGGEGREGGRRAGVPAYCCSPLPLTRTPAPRAPPIQGLAAQPSPRSRSLPAAAVWRRVPVRRHRSRHSATAGARAIDNDSSITPSPKWR